MRETSNESRIVVLTGASSGIGRATARLLAARGMAVVLTSRRRGALDTLASEITSAGGRALAVAADVRDAAGMNRVARAAVERFGRLDVWINNAGVYAQGRVQDLRSDDFHAVFDTNFHGLVHGTQAALDVMLPRRAGLIVQISSVAALRGVPYTSAYSASKSAIDGFTSALRAELWGRGVRFSILYLPTVDTPIYQKARARLGVMPRPAPPVTSPERVAEEIWRLIRAPRRRRYLGWAGPLALFDRTAPPIGDWFLHHVEGLTYSDRPAPSEDNLATPTRSTGTERAGWRDGGWRGMTPGLAIRALPWESLAAAAGLGLLAGYATRRFQRR